MSTMRRYIMGKVQKYEVLTMEISEGLKELNPALLTNSFSWRVTTWMLIKPPKQFSMGRM